MDNRLQEPEELFPRKGFPGLQRGCVHLQPVHWQQWLCSHRPFTLCFFRWPVPGTKPPVRRLPQLIADHLDKGPLRRLPFVAALEIASAVWPASLHILGPGSSHGRAWTNLWAGYPHIVFAACLLLGLWAPSFSEGCSEGAGQLQLTPGPSRPLGHTWPQYGAYAGWVQAGVFWSIVWHEKCVWVAQRWLADVCCHFKTAICNCVCWNCIHMGTISAPWLWEWQVCCAEIILYISCECMWKTPCYEQSSGQTFYCMNVWDHLTMSSALMHIIQHGISHRYFHRRKAKGLCSS